MGALWWSYQQLGVDIRRCFAYCSTFPNGYGLKRDELVRIWIAQGFVINTSSNATVELEAVGQRYFEELLTFSFLQAHRNFFGKETVEFTIHDLLHDLAQRVSGREFFRIGLNVSPEDIPRGVNHLSIETQNVAEINEKILDLRNLRTLIINPYYAEGAKETIKRKHDLEKLLGRLFMRLKKLRVLIIKVNFSTRKLSVPSSIHRMRHLRYLGFHFNDELVNLILPSTLSKLYHMQTIDIPCEEASCPEPEDMANLISLRHISAPLSFTNIGRLTSLQTLAWFQVKEEQGYGLKQLMHLNKLGGTLRIDGLGTVGSKEAALEAHLTHKERLRKLQLKFDWSNKRDPDVEAEVLEGLCPAKDLQELHIWDYKGSRYPMWMLNSHHSETAPTKHLQKLNLWRCSLLASIPQDSDLFIGLCELWIRNCDWDRLLENMEHLVSLQTLWISDCHKVELLPTLSNPALKTFIISRCDMLSKTCKEKGHENWCKIQHIPEERIRKE